MGLETTAIIAIGAAVASIGAGVASTVSQNKANKANIKLQNETNALNYQMFQEQLGFSEKMQDKQNAYNTPVAQRQRLEQAGINPYMALGNMTSGNSELASTPSANPAQSAHVLPNTGLAELLNSLGQSGDKAYQLQQMSEQVNAQRESVKAARIENLYRSADRVADINKKIAEQQKLLSDSSLNDDKRKEILANIEKLQYESRQVNLMNEYYFRTLNSRTRQEENKANLLAAQEQGQLLTNTFQELTNQAFPKMNQAQLNLLSGQTFQALMAGKASKSSAALFGEQSKLTSVQREREFIKKIGDVIDNGIRANQFKLSDFGLTSAQLQALRDGKVLEDLKGSSFHSWLDNEFYYWNNFRPQLPDLPISFFLPLK